MTTPRLLAFSGSLRKDSYNQRLVAAAADLARAAGADVKVVRLIDYNLPIYNQDDETATGPPAGCLALKADLKAHCGFLIACPEHNSSITAALKNAIDWASRPAGGEEPLECFAGKLVGLCAASPGALGGVRGLDHVREILGNIRCHIVPPGVAVSAAHQAFEDDGTLNAGRSADLLKQMVDNLVHVAGKVHG